MVSPQLKNTIQEHSFYKLVYQKFLIVLFFAIIILLAICVFVMYQILHHPVPPYYAISPNKVQMKLSSYEEPTHVPSTLLQWARKAAVAAYGFDFANYKKQLLLARPYFTAAGWIAYQNSITPVLQTIVKNQLFVSGVVSGPPVIANQGPEMGVDYAWHIQLPFLVTTQSSEITKHESYMLLLTVIKVPTNINPLGIGIDQFVMVKP